MNRKLLLLLAVVATTVIGAQAATKYEINVGGVEVTSDNKNNVTGGDIKSGTVKYDPSSNTLTLTNVTITRTGGSNYGIHNRDCAGLTMKFVGTCDVSSNTANALHFDKSTTVEVTSGSTLNASITAGENYSRGVVFINNNAIVVIKGPGTLNVNGNMKSGGSTSSCATCGFEGKGKDSSTSLSFTSVNARLNVTHDGLFKLGYVNFYASDVKVKFNYGFRALDQVGNLNLYNDVECVTPADATFNSSGGYFGGNDYYTHFTDDYGLIFSTANFPDTNFRTYMRSLCSVDSYSGYREQYLTPSEVQNLKSLDVSNKSISDLTGVSLLTSLTSLNCSSNSLTSLPTLPSGLKTFNCASNQLTYLPTLPSGIEYLDVSNNKFTTSLTVTGKTNLKTLYAQNNTSLAYLDCSSNALTSLNVSGCSAMTKLKCTYNQLTSLSTLPSALTVLYCNDNKLTSLPTLPSTLTYLDCGNNQISSLPTLPSNIESLYAHGNKLTSVNTLDHTKLKLIYLANNSALTSLVVSRNYALTSLTITSCPSLTTLSMQNLTNFNFANFSVPGTVTYYDCGFNNLTSLPTLPSGLKVLRCISNMLTSLPTLPSGLEELYCGNNKFTTMSITGKTSLKTLSAYNNTSMTWLYCNNNALNSLDVSGCTALTDIDFSSNKFTSLPTLPNSIKSLSCHNNLLTSLPTSLPDSLEILNVNNNKFTTLTITENTNLESLYAANNASLTSLDCSDNALTTLQFGGSPLTTLNCNYNQLTSLTLLPSSLKTLNCRHNQLTSLNVYSLNELTTLNCSDNKLTSLNVSANSKLEELKCHRNELASLNVQGLTKLTDFSCANNKLTSLSVQGCTALSTQLNITTNQIKDAEMTALINSLCTVPSGVTAIFYVYNQDNTNEGNTITDEQIRCARAKNWHLYKFYNGDWEELTASSGLRGDVNGDGSVDVDDMNIVINIMLGKATLTTWPAADVDGSGGVDVDDMNIIINIMLGKG